MDRNNSGSFLVWPQSPDLRAGLFLFGASLVLLVISLLILDPARPRPRVPFLSPPEIRHLTFGHREQVADSLWLRAVQDLDSCGPTGGKSACGSKGWLFRMLDLITDLAPEFRMPYAAGALALTVLVDDFEGASRLFDKGAERFPNDGAIQSRAAYHALYEEKDKEKAARLAKRAAEAGAPSWYYALSARLATEAGDGGFLDSLIQELEADPAADAALLKGLKRRRDEGFSARH